MPSLKFPNGVSLSYFSYPDYLPSSSRPTVLFLSALFQRTDIQYVPQLRDINLTGSDLKGGFRFNFVGIDVHGHGDSVGRANWDYADNAKDVVDAMETLGVDKFFVLGTSNGGLTAQEIAIRYPERVRGMILCATTARPWGQSFKKRFREILVPAWTSSAPPSDAVLMGSCITTLGAAAKPAEQSGSVFGDRASEHAHVQTCAERTAESAAGIELLSRIVDNWRTHIGKTKVNQPVEAMLNWPGSEDRLGDVKAPVLILHGVDDPTVEFERGEHILSLLPKSTLTRLVKLDGKGAHLINIVADVAPEVNAAIREWLDDCVSAGL